MKPSDIAAKEFPTGVFGYEKEDVREFLRAVADAVRERDEQLDEVEGMRTRVREAVTLLAQAGQPLRYDADPPVPERGRVLAEERLGEEGER